MQSTISSSKQYPDDSGTGIICCSDLSGPLRRLESLLKQPGNRVCADCGSPEPKWVSLNLGVFICIKCSGAHRSLGVHISKVLSVKLDEWTYEQVDSLYEGGGNTAVNMKYEAYLPDYIKKPRADSSCEERADFIRRNQNDDFFDQMLSGLPGGWSDLGEAASAGAQKLFGLGLGGKSPDETSAQAADGMHYAPYDESSLLASRLRQHQISGGGGSSPTGKQMMLQLNHHGHQQQMLLAGMGRSPAGGGETGMLPMPLTLGSGGSADSDGPFKSPSSTGGEALYNGFGGSLQRAAQPPNQQHFHHPQGSAITSQNYGGASQPPAGVGHGQSPAATASASAGGGTAPPRQRVRARRGQATDPHSIAERLRRERIAERMKNLQELVPNANKTDKASMLDEIIDYVKFLQLQVKVLSMSRLGGAAAVAPLVADMSSESGIGGRSRASLGSGGGGGGSDSMTVTEHQVAKLMEEDMGSAMQYLQGKGLCLMPISLASAISSATCHPRPPQPPTGTTSSVLNHALAVALAAGGQQPSSNSGGDGPTSPSMSVLTVQSAMANCTPAAAPDADGQRMTGGKDGMSKQ